MPKEINILIVHYNTPFLTKCLVKSINKFTPGANIYIFDNSNVAPFDSSFLDNVTILDNTRGQYIDFDRWLKKYPKRNNSGGKVNGWGSAKHCVSVEKCMSIIGKNFILLDSDVLLKRDISNIFCPECAYVGEVITQPRSTIKRVLPYICFINVEMCKKNNVHYFDENRMHGLMYNNVNKAADSYDTGAAFFLNCEKLPKKSISTEDFIVHYSGASWKEEKEKKYAHELSPIKWAEKYANLWKTDEEMKNVKNKNVIYTCITGNYEPLDEPFVISEGFDYVCFTNSNIKSDVWQLRPIPSELDSFTEVKKQRCIKINPHKFLPEYDLSIWVDGSIKLTKDVNTFIEDNCSGEENVYIPTHPTRKCIYKEMTECVKMKKDTEANISKQREKYKQEGFPENYGLVQSNIIVRRHNEPDCIKLMDTWWNELKNGSHRDQLSFNYSLWKNEDVKVKFLNKNTCESKYFKWDKFHGKKSQKKNEDASSKKRNVAVNIDEIMQSHYLLKKNSDKKPSETANKIKEVKTKNPVLRRHLISKSIKTFLKPNTF